MLSDKLVKDVIVQWDEHDRFRDFEKRGEPVEVSLARDLLALRTALAALADGWESRAETIRDYRDANLHGEARPYARASGEVSAWLDAAARIRELLEGPCKP
jgi:hypothetical protein